METNQPLRSISEELSQAVGRSDSDWRNLQAALQQSQSEVVQLEVSLGSANQKIIDFESLKSELEKTKSDKEALETSIKSLDQSITGINQKNISRWKIASLSFILANVILLGGVFYLYTERTHLEGQAAEQRRTISDQENKNKELSQKLEEANRQSGGVSVQNATLSSSLSELQTKLSAAQKVADDASTQNELLAKQVAERDARLVARQQRIDFLEARAAGR